MTSSSPTAACDTTTTRSRRRTTRAGGARSPGSRATTPDSSSSRPGSVASMRPSRPPPTRWATSSTPPRAATGGLSPTQNPTQIFGPLRSKAYEVRHEVGTVRSAFARERIGVRDPGDQRARDGPCEPAGIYERPDRRGRGLSRARPGLRGRGQDHRPMERHRRPRVDEDRPSPARSCRPTIGLQLANIAHQSFNLPLQVQGDEPAGIRRAGHLRVADQGRLVAGRERRCRVSESAEPDHPACTLAVRRLHRGEDRCAYEPEALPGRIS